MAPPGLGTQPDLRNAAAYSVTANAGRHVARKCEVSGCRNICRQDPRARLRRGDRVWQQYGLPICDQADLVERAAAMGFPLYIVRLCLDAYCMLGLVELRILTSM